MQYPVCVVTESFALKGSPQEDPGAYHQSETSWWLRILDGQDFSRSTD